jgi:hypothetical protein
VNDVQPTYLRQKVYSVTLNALGASAEENDDGLAYDTRWRGAQVRFWYAAKDQHEDPGIFFDLEKRQFKVQLVASVDL